MTLPADNAVIVGSTPTLLANTMSRRGSRRLNSHEDVFFVGTDELPNNDMTTRSETYDASRYSRIHRPS
jgi:hypothetical protein